MKVLSLLQPWASLVVMGIKRIETRSWNTKYRGELLIHASAKLDKQTANMMEYEPFWQYMKQYWPEDEPYTKFSKLPLGSIIGKVNLIDTIQTNEVKKGKGVASSGLLNDEQWFFTEQELAFGDYSEGRYGWLLSDPEQLKTPIPAKGQLGIWNFEPFSLPELNFETL